METPSITHLNWPDHVNNWPGKDNVISVKYEDLFNNGSETLQLIFDTISDKNVSNDRTDSVIDLYSFKNMTKRKAGEEDRSSFLRKGIAGDWKNHFNSEAVNIFDHYAGETLIKLGYEENHDWAKDFNR